MALFYQRAYLGTLEPLSGELLALLARSSRPHKILARGGEVVMNSGTRRVTGNMYRFWSVGVAYTLTSILFSASEEFISAESSETTAPRGGRDGRRSGEDEDFDFFLELVPVLAEETDDDRFFPAFLAGLVEFAWASSSAVGRGGTGR